MGWNGTNYGYYSGQNDDTHWQIFSLSNAPCYFFPSNPRWWYGKPKLPLRMVYPPFPTRFGVELPHDAWNCEASCELPNASNALIIYTVYSIYMYLLSAASQKFCWVVDLYEWLDDWRENMQPCSHVQPAEFDPKKRLRKWTIIGKLGNAMIVKTSLW